ncbi:MAG: formylglycine-generating enzyme family protein [Candidatus Omnitrophota bacterium]
MVSWNDCQTFIQKLNQLGQGTFRLPTEAEWEYACRAGTTMRFYWEDDPNNSQIGEYAWYDGNRSRNGTEEAGLKLPNAFGLFDMSGNVWEWCQDLYGNYSSDSQNDPTGTNSGSLRLSRGGSWEHHGPGSYRSAARYRHGPDETLNDLGFRLVRNQ